MKTVKFAAAYYYYFYLYKVEELCAANVNS